ncbi:MAG: substrate-binding domain-containing protein [Luteolibacter sp.]
MADELRSRIAAGILSDSLPGVRLLADELSVSVPTVCRALHRLEKEGVLLAGGGRRRWRVADRPAALQGEILHTGRLDLPHRRLLYISPHPLGSEKFSGVEVFAAMLDQLGSQGWDVSHRMIPFVSARKPHRSWDKLLELARPDAIVVNSGSQVVAEWLSKQSIRSCFLGGDSGDFEIPTLGVSTPTMFGEALAHLLELGHRSIWMPLCGRTDRMLRHCKETIAKETLKIGVSEDCVRISSSVDSSPELLMNMARKEYSTRKPDALVVLDWREFVALSGYLARSGIQIPKDLSVIVLSHNANMTWHRPAIAHFEIPSSQIARKICTWISHPERWGPTDKPVLIRARWIEGSSVLARNPQARKFKRS